MRDAKLRIDTDQLDFHDDHKRIGLNVKTRDNEWEGLTPEECKELALALKDSKSQKLKELATFMAAAALWGRLNPQELEGYMEVSA